MNNLLSFINIISLLLLNYEFWKLTFQVLLQFDSSLLLCVVWMNPWLFEIEVNCRETCHLFTWNKIILASLIFRDQQLIIIVLGTSPQLFVFLINTAVESHHWSSSEFSTITTSSTCQYNFKQNQIISCEIFRCLLFGMTYYTYVNVNFTMFKIRLSITY